MRIESHWLVDDLAAFTYDPASGSSMIRAFVLIFFASTALCQTIPATETSDSTTVFVPESEGNIKRIHPAIDGPVLDLSRPYTPVSGWESALRSEPDQKTTTTRQRYAFTALTMGLWSPLGHNQTLGNHPSFGIAAGQWYGQWLFEFELEFRVGKSSNSYKVLFQDTVRNSREFFGGFLGIHVGYGIINSKYSSLYLLTGIGYDGFDAWDSQDADGNSNSVSISSLNLNGGFGLQFFGNNQWYWGVEVLYNAIRYRNPGGSPLDGNALTIRLSVGGIKGF